MPTDGLDPLGAAWLWGGSVALAWLLGAVFMASVRFFPVWRVLVRSRRLLTQLLAENKAIKGRHQQLLRQIQEVRSGILDGTMRMFERTETEENRLWNLDNGMDRSSTGD